MTSAISYTEIDETFPIAGQDNNSQGFRDNFSYIKTGLETAASEITNLQANAAVTNDDNDFNGNLIENAEYNSLYGAVANVGSVPASPGSGASNIVVSDGVYQTFTSTEAMTFTFTGWPASGIESRIKIDLNSDGTSRNISFATSGGGTIRKDFSTPFALNSSAATHSIFEVWTINGGNVVYMKHLGNFS